MKKVLLLSVFILALLVSLSAQTPARTVYQKLVLDATSTTDLLTLVTNTGNTTSANYIFRATHVETGVTVGTDLGAPPQSMRIVKLGSGAAAYAAAVTNQSLWPATWAEGSNVKLEIWYNGTTTAPSGVEPYPTKEYATKTFAVPAGGNAILMNTAALEMVIPPYTPAGPSTFNINVTSTPAGQSIYLDGVTTGFSTPHTFVENAGFSGLYSVMNAAYTWAPANYPVTNLQADANINFVGTFIPVIVTPNPAVNPMPANAATIQRVWNAPATEAVTLTWEPAATGAAPEGYKLVWNGGAAMEMGLVTTYTTPAIGAGNYTWKVIPYAADITSKGIALKTTVKTATRTIVSGAKGENNGGATWTFSVAYDAMPTFNINITSTPTGQPIYLAGAPTGFDTPHTFVANVGTSALYSVVNPLYTWVPPDYMILNLQADTNIDFVGTLIPTQPTVTVTPENAPVIVAVLGENPLPVTNAFVSAYICTFSGPSDLKIPILVGQRAFAFYGGIWTEGDYILNPGFATWLAVPFGAKGSIPVVVVEPDATLPVTLSSFTAVPAAQSFVSLTWVSESESNMIGYRVYRNESTDFSNATLITPSMIGATNTSTQVTYRHEDREVALNTTYYYWLESVDMTSSELHGPITATVIGNTTPELPTATVMSNVYPNPFRMGNTANIDVALKAGETGTVTVYNILGQSVKTFPVTQGTQKLTWNGRDSKGNACGSGIYFYKLSTPSMNQTKKMVIVK